MGIINIRNLNLKIQYDSVFVGMDVDGSPLFPDMFQRSIQQFVFTSIYTPCYLLHTSSTLTISDSLCGLQYPVLPPTL